MNRLQRGIAITLLAGLAGCASPPPPASGSSARAPLARVPAVVPTAAVPGSVSLVPATAPAVAAPEPEASSPAVVQGLPRPADDATTASAAQLIAKGRASWYGKKFHGRRTASGERYDMHALTAAHKTLPFGTLVRVRSVHSGNEVVVRINDRGPYAHQRIIDLSLAAITALGVRGRGVTEVLLLRE
jgi:rare lipoprotein A